MLHLPRRDTGWDFFANSLMSILLVWLLSDIVAWGMTKTLLFSEPSQKYMLTCGEENLKNWRHLWSQLLTQRRRRYSASETSRLCVKAVRRLENRVAFYGVWALESECLGFPPAFPGTSSMPLGKIIWPLWASVFLLIKIIPSFMQKVFIEHSPYVWHYFKPWGLQHGTLQSPCSCGTYVIMMWAGQ